MVEDYRLIRPLGHGGMADVWQAERRSATGIRPIALKRIRPDLIDRSTALRLFRREAELALALKHPNIVAAIAAGDDGEPFLALEMIDGFDLHRFLHQGPAPPMGWCIYVVRQLCAALKYAHGRGVIHRDVTPSNVMLGVDGAVKLLDFGVARALADERGETTAGVVRGKRGYVAPEVLDGAPHDPRADLYSLGVILYELLARTAPPPYRRVTRDRSGRVAPPSSLGARVPELLDAIAVRALARDPGERFASAGEMAAALDGALARWPYCREQAAALARQFAGLPERGTHTTEVKTRVRKRPIRWSMPLIALVLAIGFVAPILAIGLQRSAASVEPSAPVLERAELAPPVELAHAPEPPAVPEPSSVSPARPSRGAPLRPRRKRVAPTLDDARLFNPFEVQP